jgi:hypothetical protein
VRGGGTGVAAGDVRDRVRGGTPGGGGGEGKNAAGDTAARNIDHRREDPEPGVVAVLLTLVTLLMLRLCSATGRKHRSRNAITGYDVYRYECARVHMQSSTYCSM